MKSFGRNMDRNGKRHRILLLLLVGFAILYIANISGWLMHDDEGTDFYEVWQLQQGKRPGVDFLAEQQPLFLLTGSTIVDLAGRSPLHLRLLAAVQVLLGALVLATAVRRIWGGTTAAIAISLTLGSGLVYEQARLFRPDPMMLGWEMAGLGAALLATKDGRRKLWALAGLCYGVGVLWKLFGVFPIVGLVFYFLDRLWRNRAQWRKTVAEGLSFAAPFLLASLGISVLLYSRLGFYYQEPFEQHLSLGRQTGALTQLGRVAATYAYYVLLNAIFVLIVPLWRLNAPRKWRERLEIRLLLWQFLSPLVFMAMTRPMYPRYFLHLTPVLAILLSWQCQLACSKVKVERPTFSRWVFLVNLLVVGLAVITTQPSLPRLLVRQEPDTLQLAAYVATHTQPDDKVLSDYAGINFFADRDSIYEASIVAGGRIAGQVVTGELLIRRIEQDRVRLVLVHVAGGDPPPHHLVNLVDYDTFIAYLTERFDLLTVFDRAGQQIEIYQRKQGT
jgi:4-amino-4-deoxy-L-arabinose transferase-like glycosyltransferase